MSPDRNQFGSDRHCDFLRSNRTDVYANGSMNAVKKVRSQAFFLQGLRRL